MFETTVVESRNRPGRAGSLAILPVSIGLHVTALAGALVTTMWAIEFPAMAPSKIVLYTLAAPLPPMQPLPPPPPPAGSRPVMTQPATVPVRLDNFAPAVIPDHIPEVLPVSTSSVSQVFDPEPGVLYGIEGGIEGGVEGGVLGGIVGGIVGGMVGGVLGGVVSDTPADMLRAEYDVAVPRFVSKMFPEYPRVARQQGIHGVVVVDYIIGKNGNVKDVIVLEEAHPLLAESAVKAIKRWRFRPTVVNGEAVEVIHKLSIVFKLRRVTGQGDFAEGEIPVS